ncbi:MAG: aspartate aminotransferase family protein [Longimicrobiales bacterium]
MNRPPLRGDELPAPAASIPGPASLDLAGRLRAVESRTITRLTPTFPVFWIEARGAAVRDADGSVYVDLTAGFGVAHAGHSHPAVAAAIAGQAARLAHGLGDVHPPEVKVELLEKLAAIAPGDLGVTILGSAGAEGVEAALKTARLRTGRAGIVAFEGGYHGLTYGALSVTHRSDFRDPFADQLFSAVRHVPYPDGQAATGSLTAALEAVDRAIEQAERTSHPVGAILVEPVLGRGGVIVPPAGFLPALRERCDGDRILLILDEIYTGIGRTGRWFACEHVATVPDIVVAGKALTGSLPLSAAIGTPDVMDAWPPSMGEAIHTSTFLGNPVACAAALAQLRAIEEEGLLDRAEAVGSSIRKRTETWAQSIPGVGRAQGIGLLQAVTFDRPVASAIMEGALREGILVLPEGSDDRTLAITPPAVITDRQLEVALDVLEAMIRSAL